MLRFDPNLDASMKLTAEVASLSLDHRWRHYNGGIGRTWLIYSPLHRIVDQTPPSLTLIKEAISHADPR